MQPLLTCDSRRLRSLERVTGNSRRRSPRPTYLRRQYRRGLGTGPRLWILLTLLHKQIKLATQTVESLDKRGREEAMVERLLGLLRVRVLRGVNLAVRDTWSSDPYVVLRMGKQKLKTRAIKKCINPVWNEDLTLSVEDPTLLVRLEVYDKDTFSFDDPMGNAEFDIERFLEAVKMNPVGVPNGTIITKVVPNRQNCIADESPIYWSDGKVVQDLVLRLRNVECGEVELQLQWVSVPGSRG
uniref:GTPase activating protein 1 n=1 Tax=Elaeis guineensis var. tenera TaxID=51953 RepID=A0A6I9RH80_ELAGV|nr:GTPase activating protein 1 [Elaeis guineensis]